MRVVWTQWDRTRATSTTRGSRIGGENQSNSVLKTDTDAKMQYSRMVKSLGFGISSSLFGFETQLFYLLLCDFRQVPFKLGIIAPV